MALAWRATSWLCVVLAIASSPFAIEATKDKSPREQAWQILQTGLADEKVANRTVAVQALSLLPGNLRATRLALHGLEDKHVSVRTAAAVVLGQQHAKSAIPVLKNALNDSEISVVLAAAHSLLLLKDPSAYEIYYAVLMGDRKTKQGLVESQMNRLKDPKQLAQIGISEGVGFVPFGGMGYDAFRELHKRDNSSTRANAARFLANDPDPISEDALLQTALADKNEDVRLAALDALTQRGDPKCVDRLMKNLSDEKPAVRYRTAAVIIHLSDAGTKKKKAAK